VGRKQEARLEIYEPEAQIIRWIYRAYIGLGTDNPLTLMEIVDHLNADGIVSPKGGRWFAEAIKRVVDKRDYLGQFEYCGHVASGLESKFCNKFLVGSKRL